MAQGVTVHRVGGNPNDAIPYYRSLTQDVSIRQAGSSSAYVKSPMLFTLGRESVVWWTRDFVPPRQRVQVW